VALIARDRVKLDGLVGQLASDGITAAAFPADVLDRPALTRAIGDAAARFGGIDVLEYSPVGGAETTKLTPPSQTAPEDVQEQIEFQLYGAMAAVNAAAAALRNWAINLNQELAGTGVYAAHMAIGVSINVAAIPGFPTAPAEDIAAVYWELHERREDAEHVFTVGDPQPVQS
jgi:NAD(P)-dependent dehydrogenase (short-subunit alcohol dehydrogenase family)